MVREEKTLQISMRGFQADSGRTSIDIARELGTSHQKVDYWIKNRSKVTVEYHYDADMKPVMDMVYWPQKVIWSRDD